MSTEVMDLVVVKSEITYDDFAKLDIRTGTILAAEKIPKSKKLLKLTVDFGTRVGVRTILAGIATTFTVPELLVATQVVAVLNLAPREMMGVMSHGMLLAAHAEDNTISLVRCPFTPNGAEVG